MQDKPKELCRDAQEDSTGLFDANPDCDGEVVSQIGGGVKCNKCHGWFCY